MSRNNSPESMDQQEWYKVNFDLVWEIFPDTEFDFDKYCWLKIPHFPLPNNWRQIETELLVVLPGINGDIEIQKPDEFYINKGLQTINGNIPDHIFEEKGEFNRFGKMGWSRYSLHLKKWNPSRDGSAGDNLLTILGVVHMSLQLLADETDRK